MGGLYDAATLHALLAPQGGDYSISAFDFPSMHVIQWLRTGSPCVRNGFDSCARGSATAVRHGWRRLWSLDRSECCAESTEAWTLLASLHTLRTPGVEPGSQAWEACMIPLHYVRLYCIWFGVLKERWQAHRVPAAHHHPCAWARAAPHACSHPRPHAPLQPALRSHALAD